MGWDKSTTRDTSGGKEEEDILSVCRGMAEEVLSFCVEIAEVSEGEIKGEVLGVVLVRLEVEENKVEGWGIGNELEG